MKRILVLSCTLLCGSLWGHNGSFTAEQRKAMVQQRLMHLRRKTDRLQDEFEKIKRTLPLVERSYEAL